MRWRKFAVFAVLVGAAVPAGLAAQSSPEIRVTPRVGLLTPPGWFYVEYAQFGVIPMEWTEAAILRSTVIGAAVELGFESAGVWVRGEVLRTVGGETAVGHAIFRPATQAGPATVVRTWFYPATTVTTGSLDLAFPTRFRLPWGIQPYVTGGVGAKRYAFDTAELESRPENVIVPEDGTVGLVNVGAGAVARVRSLTFDFQVRDAISDYWGERQHDVIFLAGLTLRIR
jgi:hypothetical protein